ncbi:peptidyl-prolyl cis-trans isomerase [Curvibacter sp. CHRR-16]|uniref:peptidylprolyl isomerase n=1 Tax=Curvibacter sp. CHRR-16 TaxID=2835872 RepID=UPI001BDAE372|nr:peptidylprolyl isomerase [Curvibacter sp. CHRR-16]MBT0571099.1 peptidyl-prolyl cis-trans isomerase [Curvibacter sp. CHRR-16]
MKKTIERWRLHALAGLLVLAAPFTQAADPLPKVQLTTNMGNIVIELYPEKAPKTVQNFLRYVKEHHYDGTLFHRVINGFMIQGGGFTPKLEQKPTHDPIPLETNNGLKNDIYTVAMARTGNPNSATAQFFINVTNNTNLNAPMPDGYGYAVFGKVIQGTEVVEKIKAVRTTRFGYMADVPAEPVIIQAASLQTP